MALKVDEVKKHIQDFFSNDTVTIVGSGLSAAEGIPGMGGLADELRTKMPAKLSTDDDREVWKKVVEKLDAGIGLEKSLQEVQVNISIEDAIRSVTGEFIYLAEKKIIDEMINSGRTLRFSDYIKRFNIDQNGMAVITTNYDRLIEYACEYVGIPADTMFYGNYIAKLAPEESKYSFCRQGTVGKQRIQFAPKVNVFKPHGSLTWHMINGQPYSMPTVVCQDALIVTPGANKYREGYNAPFDVHRTKANEVIDKAQRFIIIGYGFADDHLETHLRRQLNSGRPALIITQSLSSTAEELVNKCPLIMAMASDGKSGTNIRYNGKTLNISDKKYWDIRELIKEVF